MQDNFLHLNKCQFICRAASLGPQNKNKRLPILFIPAWWARLNSLMGHIWPKAVMSPFFCVQLGVVFNHVFYLFTLINFNWVFLKNISPFLPLSSPAPPVPGHLHLSSAWWGCRRCSSSSSSLLAGCQNGIKSVARPDKKLDSFPFLLSLWTRSCFPPRGLWGKVGWLVVME